MIVTLGFVGVRAGFDIPFNEPSRVHSMGGSLYWFTIVGYPGTAQLRTYMPTATYTPAQTIALPSGAGGLFAVAAGAIYWYPTGTRVFRTPLDAMTLGTTASVLQDPFDAYDAATILATAEYTALLKATFTKVGLVSAWEYEAAYGPAATGVEVTLLPC